MSKQSNGKIIQHQYSEGIKRIGILGGSFDPVHYTHLHMAEVVREECHLDEVWFIPAHTPPHKLGKQMASPEERLEMLRLALQSIPYFYISLIEYKRNKAPSYTIETMKELNKLYPNYQFYFIIGADMVQNLPEWYRIEELTKLVTFVGVTRAGWKLSASHAYAQLVQHVEMVESALSSTLIRQRVKKGKSIRFLVPENVYAYIKEHRLYE